MANHTIQFVMHGTVLCLSQLNFSIDCYVIMCNWYGVNGTYTEHTGTFLCFCHIGYVILLSSVCGNKHSSYCKEFSNDIYFICFLIYEAGDGACLVRLSNGWLVYFDCYFYMQGNNINLKWDTKHMLYSYICSMGANRWPHYLLNACSKQVGGRH
jgi:hypothetical protein